MAQVVYEDEFVTEYNDGTEEVRFSDDEWAVMAADPARFGFACKLHGTRDWLRDHQLCMICEVGEPDDYYEEEGETA